jgi:hypothetical protein
MTNGEHRITGSSPTPRPDSLFPLTGLVVPSQIRQGSGESMGRAQGVGVVVAQDPAHAREGVLGELASPLMLPLYRAKTRCVAGDQVFLWPS